MILCLVLSQSRAILDETSSDEIARARVDFDLYERRKIDVYILLFTDCLLE